MSLFVAITPENFDLLLKQAAKTKPQSKQHRPPNNLQLTGTRNAAGTAGKILELLAHETRTIQEAEEALEAVSMMIDINKSNMERRKKSAQMGQSPRGDNQI